MSYCYRTTACNATNGIANAFLSVRLSNVCIVTERKKFLYCMKERLSYFFLHEEWLMGDDSLYLKLWAKLTLYDEKRRFLIDIPQP